MCQQYKFDWCNLWIIYICTLISSFDCFTKKKLSKIIPKNIFFVLNATDQKLYISHFPLFRVKTNKTHTTSRRYWLPALQSTVEFKISLIKYVSTHLDNRLIKCSGQSNNYMSKILYIIAKAIMYHRVSRSKFRLKSKC